jgi:hypothetical protein
MNTKGKFLAFVTAGFLAIAPALAQSEISPINPLVGVWQLYWMRDHAGTSQSTCDLFGGKPTGILICLPSGVYSTQILAGPPPVQKTPGILPFATDREKINALFGYFAHFGTYSTDNLKVTWHIQAGLGSDWMPVDDTMSYQVSGDKLITSQNIDWVGHIFERRVEWRRLDVEPKGQVYSLTRVEVLAPDGTPDPEQGKWMGDHPTGQLIDLSAGYYSLQVMQDPYPPSYSIWNATKKQKLAAVLGYYADYGTYTYDPATATSTSHMLGSLWPNLRGHDLKTHPQMDGGRLINTTDPIDTGKGKALIYRWTWEAIK